MSGNLSNHLPWAERVKSNTSVRIIQHANACRSCKTPLNEGETLLRAHLRNNFMNSSPRVAIYMSVRVFFSHIFVNHSIYGSDG